MALIFSSNNSQSSIVPSIIILEMPQVPAIEYSKYFLNEDRIVKLFATSASFVEVENFF